MTYYERGEVTFTDVRSKTGGLGFVGLSEGAEAWFPKVPRVSRATRVTTETPATAS